MQRMSARGSYLRKFERFADRASPEFAIIAETERAVNAWLAGGVRHKRNGAAKPKQWHRQPQARIRESLAELLAAADRPTERLDTEGWELQVLDGDRDGFLALE